MILYLDTSTEKTLICFLGENFEILKEEEISVLSDLSDQLLNKIDGLLKNTSLCKKDISKIIVNQGPGSYTGLRIGLATANLLGYSLNIPVAAISIEKKGCREISHFLKGKKNGKSVKKFNRAVLPFYKFSPHITKKNPCL